MGNFFSLAACFLLPIQSLLIVVDLLLCDLQVRLFGNEWEEMRADGVHLRGVEGRASYSLAFLQMIRPFLM